MERSGLRIGIIGGGFSGTALAVHLLSAEVGSEIVIVEPRGQLARGIAYGTTNLSHLLNVPAGRMSLFPERMDDFFDWARTEGLAEAPSDFVPRAAFARYLEDRLAAAGPVTWRRSRAVAAQPERGRWRVRLADGGDELFDRLVLATGNRLAGWPAPAEAHPRLAVDPWAFDPAGVERGAELLLIGTGLTMIDTVLALDDAGHRGKVTALSRHGRLPTVAREPRTAQPARLEELPETVLGLLRHLRAKAATCLPGDWRAAVDGLRPITQEIWLRLPDAERRRFLRHLRSLWDIHRHRMAPEIADRLSTLMAAGRLVIARGRVRSVGWHGAQAEVAVADGGRLAADWVVNCTGITSRYRRGEDPLLDSGAAPGLVAADPLGLGIDAPPDGRLADGLFLLGPPMRGTLWEITAVPDIRRQVAALAKQLGCAPAESA